MPQRRNPEALDRAIARAELMVACLKGARRLRAALGRPTDHADRRLREAERRAEHLRHARVLLAAAEVGAGRRLGRAA
jgi:hypothetical protein